MKGLLCPEFVPWRGWRTWGCQLSPALTIGLSGGSLCSGHRHWGPHKSLARGHLVPLKTGRAILSSSASVGVSSQLLGRPAKLPCWGKPRVPPICKISSSHSSNKEDAALVRLVLVVLGGLFPPWPMMTVLVSEGRRESRAVSLTLRFSRMVVCHAWKVK